MSILREHFPRLSETVVAVGGHRVTLAAAIAIVAGWAAVGASMGFPAWWLLGANMFGTLTIVLILLLVQHSKDRNMRAVQVKVDELIRSSEAGNHLIGLEQRADDEAAALIDQGRVQADT